MGSMRSPCATASKATRSSSVQCNPPTRVVASEYASRRHVRSLISTIVRRAPLAGIGLFIVLTALAVARYPGGNRFNPQVGGYDFMDSFWCDLFDERSYNGLRNGG